MGMDISGSMIVGAPASEVEESVRSEDCYGQGKYRRDDFCEWYEELGMNTLSMYYDAGYDDQIVGFMIKDTNPLSPDFDKWVEDVKTKAEKFHRLTGIDAQLIGMQDIY